MLDKCQNIFKCLNDHNVRYIVIGGIAVGVHAMGRTTFDLDITIEPTLENAKRVLDALEDAQLYSIVYGWSDNP